MERAAQASEDLKSGDKRAASRDSGQPDNISALQDRFGNRGALALLHMRAKPAASALGDPSRHRPGASARSTTRITARRHPGQISGARLWADVEAEASPPVAPGPQFDFARISVILPPVQRKATVSSPGDPYEREADEVADKVMRMAAPVVIGSAPAAIQRKCAACEDEENEVSVLPPTPIARPLQAQLTVSEPGDKYEQEAEQNVYSHRAQGGALWLPHGAAAGGCRLRLRGDLSTLLRAPAQGGGHTRRLCITADAATLGPMSVPQPLQASGHPLDAGVRRSLEPRFGHDFASVRVHTDAAAAQSAETISARAYTVGSHIVFGPGQYAPATDDGRRLLAHELSQANVRLTASAGAPQFGLFSAIRCAYYTWKYSTLLGQCQAEYQKACGADILSDECQDFMDGAGWISDAIYACVGKKDRDAKYDLLKNCAKTAAGSWSNSKYAQNGGDGGHSVVQRARTRLACTRE